MRIVVASQYFPPEPGATQNRVGAFVDGLAERGHQVTVLCEQPNHPAGVFHAGYGRRPLQRQVDRNVITNRLWVATSPQKTTARRLLFYGTFSIGAFIGTLAARAVDVVFASSPPLPAAVAAAAAARIRGVPFVLDVRDIWPAAAQALGELSNERVIRWLEHAERSLYEQASTVTTTTLPFCDHIDRIAGRAASVHLPNGALDELIELPTTAPPSGEFVVGYAGNLGIAQGLSIVLDAAARLRGAPVRFVCLGDGPVAAELRAERDRRGLGNVEFRPGVPVEQVGAFLQSCHALLVPLRDHPLLEDFIPSKLYDAMAVGRPALVAARGQAAALVQSADAGLVVEPENGDELAAAVLQLARDPQRAEEFGRSGRQVANGLARSAQIDRLESILAAASNGQRAKG